MARFQDAWMDMLLSKNDIVSIVSSYVPLKSKGQRLWGLCPFHNEKTPSFSVTPDRQMYYCFGCGAGGGVVQFVMEMERLPYYEAIQFLAQRAGMELPEEVDDAQLRRERARKERLYAALKQAAQFFHECLLKEEGKAAREYLFLRGLHASVVKRFGLGYAPDSWNALLLHMKEAGFSENELLDAGLVNQKGTRVYDAYRNRVIFPIIGTNARVLGFGARAMGDALPKYINTSETPIYNKRRNLYGLNWLKGEKFADIVIVEGYMDVISLYAAGIKNSVASLGTALTSQQAKLIKRYATNVYIAYDGDTAGQNATLRGLDILQAEGISVRVILLPDGMDPDDFVRKNGKDAFDALRDAALPLNGFKLARLAFEYDLESEDGRQEYALSGCAFIASLQPVEQERYYLQLSRTVGIPLDVLKEQGRRTKPAPAQQRTVRHAQQRSRETAELDGRQLAELALLRVLAKEPACVYMIEGTLLESIFHDEELLAVANEIIELGEKKLDHGMLMSMLSPVHAQSLARAMDQDEELASPEQFIRDCLERLNIMDAHKELQELQARVSDENATIEEKLHLMQRINELKRRI